MKGSGKISRRFFTRSLAVVGIGSVALPVMGNFTKTGKTSVGQKAGDGLKISLNAFSFDKPLKAGTLTISGMLDYCARVGFEGVDLTGYYFPGYPVVPSDEFIYEVKKKAFKLGMGISGTGVKNDFTGIAESQRLSKNVI